MIHARADYDRIQDPEGKIGDDEPVFLLRGQDVLFVPMLSKYLSMHLQMERKAGLNNLLILSSVVRTLIEHIRRALAWQKQHNIKVADVLHDA